MGVLRVPAPEVAALAARPRPRPAGPRGSAVLALQRAAGNRATTLAVQRALWTTTPERRAVRPEDVPALPRGTPLVDDFGRDHELVSPFTRDEVLVRRLDGSVVVHHLLTDATEPYVPGRPAFLLMRDPQVLDGAQVPGSPEHHCGMSFGISLYGEDEKRLQTTGVAVLESVTTQQATGWFASAPAVVQRNFGAWFPGGAMVDLLTISTMSRPEPRDEGAEPATDEQPPSAASTSDGVYEAFQRFDYVDETGAVRPIPNSGFRLRKEMRDGVLTVRRTPAAGDGAGPGVMDGTGAASVRFA